MICVDFGWCIAIDDWHHLRKKEKWMVSVPSLWPERWRISSRAMVWLPSHKLGYSPDLNPIVHLWVIVKDRAGARRPANKAELMQYSVEKWQHLRQKWSKSDRCCFKCLRFYLWRFNWKIQVTKVLSTLQHRHVWNVGANWSKQKRKRTKTSNLNVCPFWNNINWSVRWHHVSKLKISHEMSLCYYVQHVI